MGPATNRPAPRSFEGPRNAGNPTSAQPKRLQQLFSALFGTFFGLSLLKFGNPPIMEKWVTTPTNAYELVYGFPWPITWAWYLLAAVAVVGLFTADFKRRGPHWLLILPLIWFGWQCVAGTQTLDAELTKVTLKHFAACILCFYLGFYSLSRIDNLSPFLIGVFSGFVLVLAVGIDQHFGGLEQSRRFFFKQFYLYPQSPDIPPEFIKRISSNRIYSTLFYPNVLAGALLLFLPMMLREVFEWQARLKTAAKWAVLSLMGIFGLEAISLYLSDSKVGLAWMLCFCLAAVFSAPRWFLSATLGLAAAATLYWSGSKGGWLLMLFLGLITLLKLPYNRSFKRGLIGAVLLIGLTGFFWKYAGFFQKGATSVGARFDYWQAAVQTIKAHPLFGTGPGTFFIPYKALKRPESESARLVHNDYLEQASDSGLIGFLSYTAFIVGGLAFTFKKTGLMNELLKAPPILPSNASSGSASETKSPTPGLEFTVWLGLLGLALQSLFEFGLYIPALAWPAFALMGWLIGSGTRATSFGQHP